MEKYGLFEIILLYIAKFLALYSILLVMLILTLSMLITKISVVVLTTIMALLLSIIYEDIIIRIYKATR